MFSKNEKSSNHYALSILLIMLIAWTVFFAAVSLQKHAAFQTAGFDLGNYDQAMWNTLRGRPLAITTMPNISSRWALHFEPILLLLLPVYAIFSTPQTLLITQVIAISLGCVPIFLLARRKLDSSAAGLVFAGIYLLFPALQAALVFDFHAVALAAPLLSFALWFMAERRYGWMFAATLLAMACKEDIALLAVTTGAYVWWVHRRRRWGIVLLLSGLTWFALANFVIIPAFSPVGENIHLARYARWGDSMAQVIGNLVLHPLDALTVIFSGDRLRYWVRALMPAAFTALLDPLALLLAAPVMVINTLSAYPPNYQLDRFHYSTAIVPFVIVAAINGLERVIRWGESRFTHVRPGFVRGVLLAVLLFATTSYQIQFGHTPVGRYFDWPIVTEHHRRAKAMLAQIPPEAAVAAQNNLVPHLSGRRWIFTLPKIAHQGRQADYIAFDLQSNLFLYASTKAYCSHINDLLSNPNYGLSFSTGGLLLFEHDAPDTANFSLHPLCP